jgi:hypothetical protein
MNHERSVELVERIRHYCWQVAEAAIGRRPQPGEYHDNFDSYAIRELNAFIALKRNAAQEPQLAFPPATEEQLRETEALLGFALPPLLIAISVISRDAPLSTWKSSSCSPGLKGIVS